LLDRTLIWNLPHLRRILHVYETHHNTHRPNMALASVAPDKPQPVEVINLGAFRARRHGRAGGVISEYRGAA
jgi:putative transposase